MAQVSIRKLSKAFGDVTVVKELDLEIAHGEFLTLLGPSGCGKTTTLRCLAGLEEATEGEIQIGDDVVAAPRRQLFVPPEKRGTGMVFQNYALWPHMTVRANVAYPLKLAKLGRAEISSRVGELLDVIGLREQAGRLVTQLSGGQQQRVALARAMANRPRLLLFDEPLSNLDAKLRMSMRGEIRAMHDRIGTTSVYVTHDQEEAMVLSDRIAVMHAGTIQQLGSPRELYTRPVNRFVADFMGFENIIEGTVAQTRAGALGIKATADGPLLWADSDLSIAIGTTVEVAFRSAHLRICGSTAPDSAALVGIVKAASYLGSRTELELAIGELTLAAYVDDADLIRLGGEVPGPGEQIAVTLPPRHVVLLADSVRPPDGARDTAPVRPDQPGEQPQHRLTAGAS